eukprot:INCI18073.1.p1 GENE.INCI18073.1~~INCI18073.1.p1  ORF type:complete len:346 (-),score=50.92 INCI18073.1:703-1671(-)
MNAGGVHMEEPELKRSRGSKGDDSEDTDGESDNVGRGSSDSSDGGGAAVAAASAASPATAAASDNDSNNRKPLVQDLRDLIAMNNFISRSSVHSYNNKHAGNRVIKIINGQVLRDHKLVAEDFWVKGDKIIDPMSRFWDAQCTGDLEPEDIVIDAKNCIICPGFIDIQINGAFGVDFSNPAVTSADVDYVAANMVRYGVTGFLPTVVSSQPDVCVCLLPVLPKQIVCCCGWVTCLLVEPAFSGDCSFLETGINRCCRSFAHEPSLHCRKQGITHLTAHDSREHLQALLTWACILRGPLSVSNKRVPTKLRPWLIRPREWLPY